MKTVVIDKKDVVISVQLNAIKIEQQSVPLKHIDLLVLNHKIVLSTKDILKLTSSDISILLVSYASDNFSLIQSANAKNAQIKLAQFQAYNTHIKFAKEIIKKKILTHAQHLSQYEIILSTYDELQKLQEATLLDEIMGIEGSFAKKYFQEYFALFPLALHKSKRSKQPPQDPVNALLSYWYSLYYYIITAQLLSYGFEPSIGYLHRPFRTHNALASDILELFRAQINEAVLKIFVNDILKKEDFTKKGGVYLRYEGRKKVWSHFLELCEVLKPQLDTEIATLKKMIFDEETISH